MAAMAPTPSGPMPTRHIPLLHDNLLLLAPPTMEKRQHARDKEEYHIHDAQRKGSLQHRALLIRAKVQPIHRHAANVPEIDLERFARRHVGAVLVGDAAELVDGGDQGAEEEEVDDADEDGVGFGAVVGEERGDGPGGAEDGDDEEDEDVGGREGVVAGVDVDEVG